MLHELKIEQCFADAILDGRKNFEVRKNDRGFQAGDTVKFNVPRQYYEDGNYIRFPEPHAISEQEYLITYVLSGWGIEQGFVVFGIRLIDEGNVKRSVEREGNTELREATRAKGFIFGRSS